MSVFGLTAGELVALTHSGHEVFSCRTGEEGLELFPRENPDLVLNDDLIGTEGSGELIGGSQREDSYEILKAKIEEAGLKGPEYQWYLDLRKYGSVPHSGFGIGVERVVRWISVVEHIRECIPFPRTINRIRP